MSRAKQIEEMAKLLHLNYDMPYELVNTILLKMVLICIRRKPMELNREQIIKALECCIVNDWNSTKCNECPFYNGGGGCIDELKNSTIALINSQEQKIKELTEENKAWQKQLISTEEKACKAYYELACEVEDLRAENERLRACQRRQRATIKAYHIGETENNVIQKFVKRLKNQSKVRINTIGGKCLMLTNEDIDQIAKEMLEGADGH